MVLESFNNGILYIDIAFVYNRCTVYKVFRIKGSDCMKIEKVNDNQIRCTLTRSDLAERELKIVNWPTAQRRLRPFFAR